MGQRWLRMLPLMTRLVGLMFDDCSAGLRLAGRFGGAKLVSATAAALPAEPQPEQPV